MNKVLAVILLLLIFTSFSYAGYVSESGMSDEEIMASADVMSSMLDNVKSKKDKVKVYEDFAEMFFSKGVYAASYNIYTTLLDSNPSKKKKAEYLVRLGDISAARQLYNESLEYYKSALVLYKKDNNIKKKIGDILLESNLYNLAEQSFKDILAADKHSDYAKRKLGDIYYWQKKYAKALTYYEDITQTYYDKGIIANMISCHKSLGNTDKAIKLVNNFILSNPDSEMYFLSGLLYANLSDYDKAEQQFLTAITLNDENFQAYAYLAVMYLEKGNIVTAEEMLNKASSINSYMSAIDMMYAQIAYKKGRVYDARRYASSAILKAKTPFLKRQAQRMLDFFNEKQ